MRFRCILQSVKFVVICHTKKISYLLPKKDKIPFSSCSNIAYEFACPGCKSSYIGKTESNLATRFSKHSDQHKSSISRHLSECEHANYILNLNHIFEINDSDTDKPNTVSSRLTLKFFTFSNTGILTSFSLKLFILKPVLNNGLRASKEFVVSTSSLLFLCI